MGLGILFFFLTIAILLLTDLVFAPGIANHPHFHDVMEDDYSNDYSSYIPAKENKDYISSYELKLDKKSGKRYLKLNFAKMFGEATLYLVLFDYYHKPYAIREVKITAPEDPSNSIVFLDSKVRGTSIQLMEVDEMEYQKKLPIYFHVSRLIWASVFLGLFNDIAFVFGYLSVFYLYINQMDHYEFYPPWVYVLVLFLCFLFTGGLSFFFLSRKNQDYLQGGEKK